MAKNNIFNGAAYANTPEADTGKQFAVIFKVIATDTKLSKEFDSPYLMNVFINKIRRSKKVAYLGNERRY